MFKKILIANRGEVALRVIYACRELGIKTVAVFSQADENSLHVRFADEEVCIGPARSADSYLNVPAVISAAEITGADAIHPGYGFLAENEEFADAVRKAGLIFIGPSPEVIALMGSKTAARSAAARAGVPVVAGTDEALPADASDDELLQAADRIGFPLLVKAVAGGGGKGMRTVTERAELIAAVRGARSEAGSAFGDAAVYFERRLARPRHVEVQVLGDEHGTVLPFVERECSIQRRHQKLLEETPSPAVSASLRAAMTSAAASIARSVGYTNAGTIEFLLDGDGRFHFLEMNTRLQVEHPITELVTGIDLVQWQIRIARGERLDIPPAQLLTPNGHAVECRIYAEDPDERFMPSPGRITQLRQPSGPGIRDDSGVAAGWSVPIEYDALISKLSAWAPDRASAIARMRRALGEYIVAGIRTTVPFFEWLLAQPEFLEARVHTAYVDEVLAARGGKRFADPDPDVQEIAAIAAALESVMSLSAGASAPAGEPQVPAGQWKAQARAEGLR